MAKEVAISKRLKISEAQQYMILSVLGASVILGASITLVLKFVGQISLNSKAIAEEEASIANYSKVISEIGICRKPSGSVYTDKELENCIPDSIEVAEIPGTLRANILTNLAANEALNSVPKENNSSCINPATGKNYTYKELNDNYEKANGSTELTAATQLIRSCSALRVIPDALPAFQNEEALLASLNKIFIESNWEPESISPGDSSVETEAGVATGLNPISVNLSLETDVGTAKAVLGNIERSIREFDISRATFSWSNANSLTLEAAATAYYMDESSIVETERSVTTSSSSTKTGGTK